LAQALALLSLLKKLMSRELNSFSSVRFNNFLFCILFLISGSVESARPKDAFWTTFFFQIVILVPLLVTFAVDTQHRLPALRVATWPLTNTQRFLLSSASFALNPLFLVLFFGFWLWMGIAIALFFLLMALIVHVTVYAVGLLSLRFGNLPRFSTPMGALKLGGIAHQMWKELTGTLDFWAALLAALSGTLYRLLGQSPSPAAFPILSLFVGIAMSTIGQRMFRLDEGRSLPRYRLLPIAGWKLLVIQDLTFLVPLTAMVSFLNIRTGVTFGLVALAVGRYPSLMQHVNQRRWRFVGGDPRFGLAQVLLGGVAGIEASRIGLWILTVSFVLYVCSLFWGQMLWKRSANT
jgi:hypothetical protein